MSEVEKTNLLNALNIDSYSLIPKTENEFKKESSSLEAAQTQHRYHHQRLLLNYQRIKEFMKKS